MRQTEPLNKHSVEQSIHFKSYIVIGYLFKTFQFYFKTSLNLFKIYFLTITN